MKNQIDELILVSKNELVIIYTHRSPVSITGEDAYSLYVYLQTPTEVRYTEFRKAMDNDLEDTAIAA